MSLLNCQYYLHCSTVLFFCVDIYGVSFACYRQSIIICLRRPAQYSELLQAVEQHFGRHLSMECAISNGEVCKAALVSLHMEQGHIPLSSLQLFFPGINMKTLSSSLWLEGFVERRY